MRISNLVNTLAAPSEAGTGGKHIPAPSDLFKPVHEDLVSLAAPEASVAPSAEKRDAAPAGSPSTGSGGAANAIPSFITPASLASVSGGSTVVMLIWQVAQRLFGASANTPWIPFWSAIAVGTVIYLMSVGDKNVSMSTREKIIGGFIALVNSLVLFSAALGIAGPIAPGSH